MKTDALLTNKTDALLTRRNDDTDRKKKEREEETDRQTYFFLPWTVYMHACHQCPNSSVTEAEEYQNWIPQVDEK